MASKLITASMVLSLLLLFTLIVYADARPNPALLSTDSAPLKTQRQHVADVGVEKEENNVAAQGVGEEESCEEGPGEDECLMRRTLADRTDYIYTQSNDP